MGDHNGAMTKITDDATRPARGDAAAVDGQARDRFAVGPGATERFPPYPRDQQVWDRIEAAIWAVSEETWAVIIRSSIIGISTAVVIIAVILAIRHWPWL
jgi:hypothetical protein